MPVLARSRLRRTRLLLPAVQALTQRILDAAGCPGALVSLDFIGDVRMRRLNRSYRGLDAPTDVLAFAMREAHGPRTPLLGDVVISLDTAARQAAAQGHDLRREIAILLVHGILHLLGFDHERGAPEARRMKAKERAILSRLIPLPPLVAGKRSA
jgi:rRNA maturation RNase YbeY